MAHLLQEGKVIFIAGVVGHRTGKIKVQRIGLMNLQTNAVGN